MVNETKENFRLNLVIGWIPHSERLLEVGCSEGHNYPALKNKTKEYYGLEPDKKSVLMARRSFPKVSFSLGMIEKTKYRSNYFDSVVLMEVFEHTENENASLNEMFRILKNGGIVVITTPLQWISKIF